MPSCWKESFKYRSAANALATNAAYDAGIAFDQKAESLDEKIGEFFGGADINHSNGRDNNLPPRAGYGNGRNGKASDQTLTPDGLLDPINSCLRQFSNGEKAAFANGLSELLDFHLNSPSEDDRVDQITAPGESNSVAEAAERRLDDGVAREARRDGFEIRDFAERGAAGHSVFSR